MSVDCSAMLKYGWRVEAKDIPDLINHCDNGWEDVFKTSDGCVVLCGKRTRMCTYDAVTCDNEYVGYFEANYYIGLPVSVGKGKRELCEQLDDSQACEVYRLVMGREPDTPPEVLLFTRWW